MNTQQWMFRLSPRRTWLLLATLSFFLGLPTMLALGGILGGDKSLVAAGALVGVIMLPFALFLWFSMWYPRLVLTEQGLQLRGTGGFGSVSVPWQLVERLRLDPGTEALILAEPLDVKYTRSLRNWSGFSYRGAQFYSAEQQALLNDERYIPLEAYAAWFEKGDLLNAFRQFAPQLVENFQEERQSARERQAGDRWILAVVFGVTGLILLLAIVVGLYGDNMSPATQALWARLTRGMDVIILITMLFVLSVYTVVNARSSLRFFRNAQLGLGFLWLVVAGMQLVCALACLGWLIS